jgi:DNA-binding SARP family transcriptional activator
MEFRLLGPLEILEAGLRLELGGVKQRSLIAVLLLHANEVVSVDRLVDELWGSSPPRTATKSIQVYVSRLRKQLGDDRLITTPPGYVLCADPSEIDVARVEELIAAARQSDPPTASRLLREALGLWRGAPLGDLAFEPFAQTEVVRLDELRWVTLERRIDADLAGGRHDLLLAELRSLVGRHPLRERLHGQLMLALYRAGRQAEALDAYRRARQTLVEELGLEPGEELKRLERAMLEQDPALDLSEEARVAAQMPGRPPAPGRSLIVAPSSLPALDAVLALARPLASERELIVIAIAAPAELGDTASGLAARRDALLADHLTVRTAAFASPTPAQDLARMAAKESAELLLTDIEGAELDTALLEHAPCDVALLVRAGGPPRAGPVVVTFGAAWHDWAALDLGAAMAGATGAPLQLLGASADHRRGGRDASRLLADASLILQRSTGIAAEPLLAAPGRHGVIASAGHAGLLIMGLSDRWRTEGLGRLRRGILDDPPAPTVLVRRGPRRSALEPPESATRFGWSLTASPS